jgi:hypothetical protein
LHDHSFTNIIFYLPSNLHWGLLKSCVELGVSIWLLTRVIILFFHLALDVLSTMLHTRLGLSHPLVLGVSHYVCNMCLDPMGIHLLCCTHGGERTTLHVVMWDAFEAIVENMRIHDLWEQTHVLPPLQPLHLRIDIVLLVDGVCMLVDVVIANPIWVDLVS